MYRILLAAGSALSFLACGGTSSASASLQPGCYGYEGAGSTVDLRIDRVEGPVTGSLRYALAEKDRNEGTITGELRGDTLLATYTFNSEGRTSTREVAFLVQNGALVEGYGPVNEAGTDFRDRRAIEFSSTMPLQRQECED